MFVEWATRLASEVVVAVRTETNRSVVKMSFIAGAIAFALASYCLRNNEQNDYYNN